MPKLAVRFIFMLLAAVWVLPASGASLSCSGDWHRATLTNYESYPEPGSEECIAYNGCEWAGQFYGVDGKRSESWIASHNIVAIHLKDWRSFGNKFLQLRQGNRTIVVHALDACSDADCEGCCTANLGANKYLIDIEKFTMQRFGSGEGDVDFRVCEIED